jgi:hypothetical protein
MPLNQLIYSSFNFNCKEWKAFVYPDVWEYFIIRILSLLILTLSREHLHILALTSYIYIFSLSLTLYTSRDNTIRESTEQINDWHPFVIQT